MNIKLQYIENEIWRDYLRFEVEEPVMENMLLGNFINLDDPTPEMVPFLTAYFNNPENNFLTNWRYIEI